MFRTWRKRTLAWVESKFKLATQPIDPRRRNPLRHPRCHGTQADGGPVTPLNHRLTQLAATDGLTGLTNRRTFDGFLPREYEAREEIAVLLSISTISGVTTTPTDIRPAIVA